MTRKQAIEKSNIKPPSGQEVFDADSFRISAVFSCRTLLFQTRWEMRICKFEVKVTSICSGHLQDQFEVIIFSACRLISKKIAKAPDLNENSQFCMIENPSSIGVLTPKPLYRIGAQHSKAYLNVQKICLYLGHIDTNVNPGTLNWQQTESEVSWGSTPTPNSLRMWNWKLFAGIGKCLLEVISFASHQVCWGKSRTQKEANCGSLHIELVSLSSNGKSILSLISLCWWCVKFTWNSLM